MKTKARTRSRRMTEAETDRRDAKEANRIMKLIKRGKIALYRYDNAMDIFR